jgi:hypothetical protein
VKKLEEVEEWIKLYGATSADLAEYSWVERSARRECQVQIQARKEVDVEGSIESERT